MPTAGETIRIRQETMLVVTNVAGNFGGNCPAAQKRIYTVNRDGSADEYHAGGRRPRKTKGAKVSVIRAAPASSHR